MMLYCGHCGHGHTTPLPGSMPCQACNEALPVSEALLNEAVFAYHCPQCSQPNFPLATKSGQLHSCDKCWYPHPLPELAAQPSVREPGQPVLQAGQQGPAANSLPVEEGLAVREVHAKRKALKTAHCAICQTDIEEEETIVSCPDCETDYHLDCWQENQGCAIYGCGQVPETEHLQSIEIPVSYWGQEHKPCPVCEQEILAAAIRCKHCGTVFSSAKPTDTEAYWQQQQEKEQLPRLRRTIVWLVVCCILPFTAPLGGLALLGWYLRNSRRVSALPALYGGLVWVGLGLAALQTLIFLFVMIIY